MDIDIDLDWERGKSPRAFAKKLALFEARLDRELKNAMEDAVLWVERDAKQFAPVDTGYLRSSIASIVEGPVRDEVRGIVGSDVNYAPFPRIRHVSDGGELVLETSG